MVATDKASYEPNDTVSITGAIENKSANSMISAFVARINVKDQTGTVLYTEDKQLLNLLPGGKTSLTSYWDAGLSSAGTYSTSIDVIVDNETVSTSAASFTIKGMAVITGELSISPETAPAGGTVQASYTIRNSGNADSGTVTPSIVIYDPETGQQITELILAAITLKQDEATSQTQSISLQGCGLKTYTATLRYSDTAAAKTIASASFTVKDLTPPTMTVLYPTTGATYTSTVSISAFVTDDASSLDYVEYQRDERILEPAACNGSVFRQIWDNMGADHG